MSVRADQHYNGRVLTGNWMESRSGTVGFQIRLECEDGEIAHVIWLTEATADRARQDFKLLGADPDRLNNSSYMDNELPTVVVGRLVGFKTKEEVWKGNVQVKVNYLTKKRESAEEGGSVGRAAAKFFRGAQEIAESSPAPREEEKPFVATDDDIPFGWLVFVPLVGSVLGMLR